MWLILLCWVGNPTGLFFLKEGTIRVWKGGTHGNLQYYSYTQNDTPNKYRVIKSPAPPYPAKRKIATEKLSIAFSNTTMDSYTLGRKGYLTSRATGRKTSDIGSFPPRCTLHCIRRQDTYLT